MTRTVHRIISGGRDDCKTVSYQSRPGGGTTNVALCNRCGCPDPFPTLNKATVKYTGMICQHHAKEELNAVVSLRNNGATIISFNDPRHRDERRITIQTSAQSCIANAKIPKKYCSDPNDSDRAQEIFKLIEAINQKSLGSGIICCNSECQTKVIARDTYCRYVMQNV
eukprot:scaffold10708_cov157-Skeletonema_dohrnii-CCMP3373.AAC.3